MRPRIVVFASGTTTGGGSGFENLVIHSRGLRGLRGRGGDLDADIVAVVSNLAKGGVAQRAGKLGIPFIHFDPGHSHILENVRMSYRQIVEDSGAGWVALSGWTKFVHGLDPTKTFNIHPALLSQLGGRFGGKGMYGHKIHQAVHDAFKKGEISESGFSMHFVTDEYDRGPVFFEHTVSLEKGMRPEDIARVVNAAEHEWQPKITNKVVHGEILPTWI